MAGAFFANVAANLVAKLGEYLFAPIGRQFGYVLLHDSYVEDLENGVRELEIAMERVQESINEALHDGKPIHTDVRNWQDSAKEVAKEAEKLLKRGESAKYTCFRGWLPNPLMRHAIGEKVKKMTQVIRELYEKSQNSNFQKVYHENTPIGIVTATTSATTTVDNKEYDMESRAKITEDVMKAIVDDKFCVIGVWGVGGVGKSKLLEDIERQVKEKKLFNVVVKANVSRNPDLKRIQGEIAFALGLRLTNDEPTRGRANRLCQLLESDPNKSILIILDNLWEKLELKEVGIPCGYDNKARGCKLLLTSRYRDVLCYDMGCDKEFHLEKLEHGEARRFFERVVGDKVNDRNFEPLIDGVVQKCGGLPLLILSVAKRLKRGDLVQWGNALTYIEESDVKSIMELNYNDLKDERIKSLFLICALSSGRIHMWDSMVYCIGLGLFRKFTQTIEKARDRLIQDTRSLQDSSLLLESENEVRMHDIFVDRAISIASTEWSALVGRKNHGFKEWSKDELRKCTAMSFHFVGIHELPKKLDCPNLRILLLFEDNPSLKIPTLFFESMENLQVLDMTGLSFTSLPSSIEFLENLKSLNLDDCHLEDVTILGKLKGLQCLGFSNSSIARLPREIGALTDLRILTLNGCTSLKVIEPGVLGNLVKLECLSFGNSFDQWEDQDQAPRSNASLTELKNMKDLSMMVISIPHSTNLLGDLPFGKLKIYFIQIGDVWDSMDDPDEERTLKLKLDSGNLLDEEWVQRCLRMAQDLYLDGLQDGNDSINDLCIQGFQELKHLHIQNSISLQYIIHSSKYVQCNAFPKLESLFLKNLNSLEKICHGCLGPESFDKLKIVKVDNCGEIKYLFSLSMMRIFLKVEEIEISRCRLMQQIVTIAEVDEVGDELPISKEIWNSQFPSDASTLKFLKVEDCIFLLSIIPSYLLIKLQNLEAITVERCQLIREIFDLEGLTASGDVEILPRLTKLTLSDLPSLELICSKNPRRLLCFQNLRALKVQNCENLRFLFSTSVAKVLKQIKEIEIMSCKLIEKIMDVQEEESKEAATTYTLQFPLLTSLSLEELPNLRTFSQGKYRIHCPSLIRLRISGCPKMTTFSSFEGKQQLVTAYTGLQQDSGLSSPALFNQNVLFPSLEELTLLLLCGLRRIWQNELPEESFCKLSSITVRDCENLSHIFPLTSIERFQSLKRIEVVQCISLEALMEHVAVNSKERQKGLVLSDLKEVKLWHLPRLNAIWTSNTKATFYFPNLTNVSLHYCHNLRYLFTHDTLRTLHELEMLDISGCNNMQEVVAMEEGEERKLKAVKFSHLRTLKLCSLKSLVSFSSGSCAFEFPSLRNLSILECTEFKTFILRLSAPCVEMMNEGDASFDEGPYSLFDKKVIFPKLEELRLTGIQSREFWENEIDYGHICCLKVLEVKHCHNLLNVIPSFMSKRLLHYLESLTMESCDLIEGIYTLEGLSVMEREAARSSPLRELSLCNLPNLTYIWKNEDLLNLCLHNLTSIRVGKCPRLRSLFTMSMAKSLGQLRYLSLCGCEEMEYTVVREEEKPEEAADIIVFPQLVTLYLCNMPKLRSFCQGKHISEWPALKEFTAEYCKAVKVILGHTSHRKLEGSIPMQEVLLLLHKVKFPNMESMKISHMDNMEKIWVDELASNAFSKLKTLIVKYCEKLSLIFSSESILARFQNLEKLVVTDCGSLEMVFQVQEFSFSEAHSISTFQLRELVLIQLPKLKHVWSGLPSFLVKSMTQLEKLEVWYCGVEEIIVEEDGGVGTSAGDLFFPRLTKLSLCDLPQLRGFHRKSHTSTWPLLKDLKVIHCGKMRSFSFASGIQNWHGTTVNENQPALFSVEKVIPQLNHLTLAREDVEMMQHYIFGNLKELGLICYHDENVAFPSNFLLQRFPNLEKLFVHCNSFEEIFTEDAFGHGGETSYGGLSDMQKPLKALENLKHLYLTELCNLRRVWKDGSLMAEILKQIEVMYIRSCPSLSIIFPSPISFQSLKNLTVENCAGLIHMGTCSAVTSLVHLTRLVLKNCHAMEDVVIDDGNGVEETSFPKLQWLTLDGLPSLESFSSINCAFTFPSLVGIIVTKCPKINIFCKGALRTPKLNQVLFSYQDHEGHLKGDLNTTIQTLSARNDPH